MEEGECSPFSDLYVIYSSVHMELSQFWLLVCFSYLLLGFISTIYLGGLTYKMLPDYFSC
jgi:hypothetical protein